MSVTDNYPIQFHLKTKKNNSFNKLGMHKYFDKIYVITLEKRKEYVTNVFSALDTYPKYINALFKDDLKNVYEKICSKKIQHSFGEIGCYYSHRQALKDCVNSKAKICAIFEDDMINVHSKDVLFANIEQSLKELPGDWEMLFLGRCLDDCEKMVHISPTLIKPHFTLCTHAYIVNQKGAAILLQHSIHMKKPIDMLYAKLVNKNKIKGYAVEHNFFNQNCLFVPSEIRNSQTCTAECLT